MEELTQEERARLLEVSDTGGTLDYYIKIAKENARLSYWYSDKLEGADISRFYKEGDFWTEIARKLER